MDYYVKIILHANELQDKEIEVDMFFGRVPLSQIGKDIVFNVHASNLTSGGTFYTDTNGLRFMERVANLSAEHVDRRLGMDHHYTSIMDNVYPVHSAIMIEDEKKNT